MPFPISPPNLPNPLPAAALRRVPLLVVAIGMEPIRLSHVAILDLLLDAWNARVRSQLNRLLVQQAVVMNFEI